MLSPFLNATTKIYSFPPLPKKNPWDKTPSYHKTEGLWQKLMLALEEASYERKHLFT